MELMRVTKGPKFLKTIRQKKRVCLGEKKREKRVWGKVTWDHERDRKQGSKAKYESKKGVGRMKEKN